ncbi:MAG: carbonic anhydrase [Cytophagia bacterium]|nr:carbonic anhydrase [Cytophagia bacterium]
MQVYLSVTNFNKMKTMIKHLTLILIIILPFKLMAQSADSILLKLINGNKRFMSQMTIHPNDDFQAVVRNSTAQKPYALIHTCADSRVSPELIFDQGIGDLFVTRVAGNVMGEGGLGSIEYAVEHLGVRFIFILGHTKCGAVTAAVSGAEVGGNIPWLIKKIEPSYHKVRNRAGDIVDLTARENVLTSIKEVVLDKSLDELVYAGEIYVAGGIYHIENGVVEITVPPAQLLALQSLFKTEPKKN